MDEMLAQFKSMEDLKAYSGAQYQTILELSRKLQALQEENAHLQKVFEGSLPPLELVSDPLSLEIPNEKIIAEIQLGILKQKAMSGPQGSELSLEECRKVSEYAKILANLRESGPKKPDTRSVEVLSNSDLLKQLACLEKDQ